MFRSLDIDSDSVVMLHGDAGAFLSLTNSRNDLNACVEAVLDYFALKGTTIVPTFTYSATKKQRFSISETPSSIGYFSELFRMNGRMKRTKHPNFSVSVAGQMTDNALQARLDDAFGNETIFDLVYKVNAQLVTIGCSVNALTFTHYVEQQNEVSYRFMKTFMAEIEEDGKIENLETNYFVRNLDLDYDTSLDLTKFECKALNSGALRKSQLGRFETSAIKAKDCFILMSEMLRQNERALIGG